MKLEELNTGGERVLLRVDFNVPLDDKGAITDDTRIQRALPTITHLVKTGAKVILMSHLGRPKGERVAKYSLAPCAKRLSELLGKEVAMATDCVGPDVTKQVETLKNGDLLLLENLRFHNGETDPETHPEFVNSLAKLGTCYVNDAFGTAHRKHASTYFVPKLFAGKSSLGYLMEKEVQELSALLEKPERPFYAIVGGAKVSSKMGILQALSHRVNGIFVGGGMIFTFYKALGISIGDSIVEDDQVETAKAILSSCKDRNIELFLPEDIVTTNNETMQTIDMSDGIPDGFKGMDIGPKTIAAWREKLLEAKTIFWNGPVGVFENPDFAKGTTALANTLAESNAVTVAGGGDCVAAINQAGVSKKFTHISTGGGASLEYIEYGHLPGVDVIVN